MEDLMHPKVSLGREVILQNEEENTKGVSNPTTCEEDKHERSEILSQGLESDEDQPSHGEIEYHREERGESEIKKFDAKTYERQSPDNAKE